MSKRKSEIYSNQPGATNVENEWDNKKNIPVMGKGIEKKKGRKD